MAAAGVDWPEATIIAGLFTMIVGVPVIEVFDYPNFAYPIAFGLGYGFYAMVRAMK